MLTLCINPSCSVSPSGCENTKLGIDFIHGRALIFFYVFDVRPPLNHLS